MTEEQIQASINAEYNEYLKKPFSNTLPDWFQKLFLGAYMNCPQSVVPHRSETIRAILGKRPEEITLFEAAVMIQTYAAVPPKAITNDIKKFIEIKLTLETLWLQYTKVTQKELERLSNKAYSLNQNSRSRIISADGIGANNLKVR